mgnify:CR=1 FL=1
MCEQPDAIARLARSIAAAWTPTPHLTVSEIASKHLILSPEYSKITGPVNLDLYPYLKAPMDNLTPGQGTKITVFQGPIQSGKTIIGMGFMTAVVGFYHGPMLSVTSHESKAEEFSKTRFDLMVRDSPLLASKVAPPKAKDKSNTILLKTFRGGTINFVGAQSEQGLTSKTIKYVHISESDDHALNVGSAGSSIELALNRMSSFGDMAKALIESSPKLHGASKVEYYRQRGTDRVYLVECIHCGHMQPLEPCDADLKNWRLVWPKGDYSDVHYICEDCGGHMHNSDKPRMFARSHWSEPRNPNYDPDIESYSINFMYYPTGMYSWSQFAVEWDAAVDRMKAGDMDPIRTLINTRLARTFVDRGESLDAHELADRVEPSWEYVPDDVQLITMATDVQGGVNSRLETMWIGWGESEEAWMLDYIVTPGEVSEAETWTEHDKLRGRLFHFADGRKAAAGVCFIDRGFSATEVLQHTLKRGRAKTYAIKGVDGTPKDSIISNVAQRTNLAKVKNAPYYTVRTVAASDAAATMLRVSQPGARYLHIPEHLVKRIPFLLDGLTAEERHKVRGRDGKVKVTWAKKHEDKPNEPWDLLKYNIAARVFACLSGFVFKRSDVTAARKAAQEAASAPVADLTTTDVEKILSQIELGLQSEPKVARKKRPKTRWLSGRRF